MSRGHQRGFSSIEFPPTSIDSSVQPQVSEEDLCLFPQDQPGFRPVASIFPLLHLALAAGPVCLEIPETLFVSETGRDALLFNDEKRSLRLYESSEALEQFFAQCCHRLSPSESSLPLYIYHSEGAGYRVLFDPAEAVRLWKGSREASRTLQRYVVPRATEPTKIRVVWRKDQGFRRFRIQKKSLAVFKGSQAPRSNSYNSLTSAYKYDLCTFRHAGQLKKSSFSPYLPFKSVLYEELSRQQASKSGRTSPLPHSNDSFLVSSRLQGDYRIEEIAEVLPVAERMAQTLRDAIGRVVLGETEVLEALAYDVIQGTAGEFYLVSAKWIQVGKHPVAAVACPTDCTMQLKGELPTRDRGLRRKFTRILLSQHSSPMPKAPFIDLKDIQANQVLHYQPHSPLSLPSYEPDPMLTHLRASLSEAESRLDSMQQHAAQYRSHSKEVQTVKLQQYSEKKLEQVLAKVYERMRTDPLTMDYFGGKNKGEINMIKQGFYKAFTGVDNYYFKRNVKKRHEGMGISARIFAQFMRIFVEVMREEGVKSDDIHLVEGHLRRFAEDIVEDEEGETAASPV